MTWKSHFIRSPSCCLGASFSASPRSNQPRTGCDARPRYLQYLLPLIVLSLACLAVLAVLLPMLVAGAGTHDARQQSPPSSFLFCPVCSCASLCAHDIGSKAR